jgi:N-acetyl-D-muramate 6-phosphate phosphatase
MSAQKSAAAILFDVGGILLDITARPEGFAEVARQVDAHVMSFTGLQLGETRILSDIQAAAAAYSSWKFAQSRRARPREITHQEFWEDFVAADWPLAAKQAVTSQASELSWAYEKAILHRVPMEGGLTVLRAVQAAGIKTGVISNTLVGALARAYLQEFGYAEYLDVQLYSDETGSGSPTPKCSTGRLPVWMSACPMPGTWETGLTGMS